MDVAGEASTWVAVAATADCRAETAVKVSELGTVLTAVGEAARTAATGGDLGTAHEGLDIMHAIGSALRAPGPAPGWAMIRAWYLEWAGGYLSEMPEALDAGLLGQASAVLASAPAGRAARTFPRRTRPAAPGSAATS